MTKTSKVTEIKPWTGKPDQYGNVKHNITFENGEEGVYNTLPKNAPSEGDTFEYEITPAKWSSGKEYMKISKPQKEQNKGNYKHQMQTWKESMTITRDSAIVAAAQFYGKNSIGDTPPQKVKELADRFVKFITHGTEPVDFPKWGETHSRLMHRSSAVKSSVLFTSTEDDAIKAAMAIIGYIND